MPSFVHALVSPRRSSELDDADDLFGFLIGHWHLDAVFYGLDGQVQRSTGDLLASWVLEGVHYSAEKQGSDGRSWRLYLEVFGRR